MGIDRARKEGGAGVTRGHIEGKLRTYQGYLASFRIRPDSGVDIVFDLVVMKKWLNLEILGVIWSFLTKNVYF